MFDLCEYMKFTRSMNSHCIPSMIFKLVFILSANCIFGLSARLILSMLVSYVKCGLDVSKLTNHIVC
jgi:hypothetical protein